MAQDRRTNDMKSLTTIIFLLTFMATIGQTSKILSGNKVLTYRTEYIDSTNKIHIQDTVKFITTNIPWKYQPDKQTTVVWKYSGLIVHDSIKKKIFSINWGDIDSTGAIEGEEYWIHPTRNKHYTITEIAPFPLIELPCAIGNKFKRTLKIGNGWGSWSNLRLPNNYEITGKDSKTISNSVYDCWVTKAQNDSQLGISSLTTKFNENIGFVDFNYSFYNKATLRLELIKIE
jgi:hypothetical protein